MASEQKSNREAKKPATAAANKPPPRPEPGRR